MNAHNIVNSIYEQLAPILERVGCSFPHFHNAKIKVLENNNCVIYVDDEIFSTLNIRYIDQAHDNVLLLGENCRINGEHSFAGRNNITSIGRNINAHHLAIHVDGDELIVGIGSDVTIINSSIFCAGQKSKVIIGDDCLFSHGISIRNNDDHGIFDLNSLEHLNAPKDIYIQPHVWICPNTTVLKESVIGMGSVLGTNTITTGYIPPFSLAAGVPAKILRTNISWDHSRYPRSQFVTSKLKKIQKDFNL
jgi:acetyltransferase-like isoleucine patch superfamily enzyme